MQREGIFREMKLRNYYEKPSEKRAREKAEAIRRARKLAARRLSAGARTAVPAEAAHAPRRSQARQLPQLPKLAASVDRAALRAGPAICVLLSVDGHAQRDGRA